MNRNNFIKLIAGGIGAISSFSSKELTNSTQQTGPIVISSANGLRATDKAMELINNGSDALDAVIAGVNIIEDDPDNQTVGYGGFPNEDGEVVLDACCMHGPTHNAGSVASLKHIKNPSKVAKLVMERTDHVLLVGDGALKFAKAHGFAEEDLLTEESRKTWLNYKEKLSKDDDWFPPNEKEEISNNGLEVINDDLSKRVMGTISCLGIDVDGNISGVTTTSGLFYKIPGRVGDSPIIGAGLYVDNEVGACGSTGRGEENLKNLSSFLVVEFMRQGLSPEEACLKMCKRIVDHARHPSLKNEDGSPSFNVNFYALAKNGTYGCASIYGPPSFSVNDGQGSKKVQGAYLYER